MTHVNSSGKGVILFQSIVLTSFNRHFKTKPESESIKFVVNSEENNLKNILLRFSEKEIIVKYINCIKNFHNNIFFWKCFLKLCFFTFVKIIVQFVNQILIQFLKIIYPTMFCWKIVSGHWYCCCIFKDSQCTNSIFILKFCAFALTIWFWNNLKLNGIHLQDLKC